MTRPDFFIVGAPKCGTTALYEYLKAHPDVFMPSWKEPHFFGSDLHFTRRHHVIRDLNHYLALYSDWRGEQAIGDPSVWYLYSKAAPHEIRDFAPDARIIAMLRNPVDMIYSVYHQSRFDGNETLATFEEALAAEPARKLGQQLPDTMLLREALYYSEIACFSQQLQRYFNTFGRERVHVILFDDFTKRTAEAYQATLKFLEVDPSFTIDFSIINSHKQVRSSWVRDKARDVALRYRALLATWGVDPDLPGYVDFQNTPENENGVRLTLRQQFGMSVLIPFARFANTRIKKLNANDAPRPPMNPELRRQLQRQFTSEVENLSTLLDRDLTHWLH